MVSQLLPVQLAMPETAADDLRLGHLFQEQAQDDTRVVLIGFPCDEGVVRNGGRAGAAAGPAALRDALYRLTPDARPVETAAMKALLEHTADLGDVILTGRLETDQAALGEVVAEQLGLGRRVVVLGGGHETTYGHFLGYVDAERRVGIVNWDAHTDVRPLVEAGAHSGSPFFQALEHESQLCTDYTVAGALPWSVSPSHREFIEHHGGTVIFRDDVVAHGGAESLRQALVSWSHRPDSALVTFDLDAVEASSAPGVSAPGVGGLPIAHWLGAAHASGHSPLVTSIDVVELNPRFDQDGRTARLAALTVWSFLAGAAAL